MEAEKIVPVEDLDSPFLEGMPDYVGLNYAAPIDHFWQTEIEYNGTNQTK